LRNWIFLVILFQQVYLSVTVWIDLLFKIFALLLNMYRLLSLNIVLLVFFYSLQFALAQDNTCDIRWHSTVQISHDSVLSNLSQLSVTGDTIHIIWFGLDTLGNQPHAGIQYSHSFDGGQSFSPQITLASPMIALSQGFMAGNRQYVYVVYLAIVDTFYGAVLRRSTDAGITWLPTQNIRRNAQPQILLLADSSVYIHFLDQDNSLSGFLESSDHGATWITRTLNMELMQEIVSFGNQFHAVSSVELNKHDEVGYYYSIDFGVSWIGPEILSRVDPTPSTLPKIAVNEQGNLFVVWNDTGIIVLRRSEDVGTTWSPEIILTQEKGAVFSDVASESEFVSVVWDNDFGGSGGIRIRQSNDLASSFCPIDLPTTSTKAGEPSLKIFGNSVHVTWSEEVETNGEIFYRRGLLTPKPNAPKLPPKQFALKQNYPNPFNGYTHIQYDVAEATHITLNIYDIIGQKIATLVDKFQEPEQYNVPFDANNYPSGVYFYRLKSDKFVETKKLLIIR
jgi:hypothetical protein